MGSVPYRLWAQRERSSGSTDTLSPLVACGTGALAKLVQLERIIDGVENHVARRIADGQRVLFINELYVRDLRAGWL